MNAHHEAMTIDGYQAVITYDPEIEMFRGEFVGLAGGADFYARDIDGLHREGEVSLRVFLEACKEDGAEPIKRYSGKFVLRVDPETHARAVIASAAHGKSLNQWVADVLSEAAE